LVPSKFRRGNSAESNRERKRRSTCSENGSGGKVPDARYSGLRADGIPGYLRRDADEAPDGDFSGYNFWLTKLNQFNGNFTQAEMVQTFISSLEYRSRFGQP
jgi:hypothetical protein